MQISFICSWFMQVSRLALAFIYLLIGAQLPLLKFIPPSQSDIPCMLLSRWLKPHELREETSKSCGMAIRRWSFGILLCSSFENLAFDLGCMVNFHISLHGPSMSIHSSTFSLRYAVGCQVAPKESTSHAGQEAWDSRRFSSLYWATWIKQIRCAIFQIAKCWITKACFLHVHFFAPFESKSSQQQSKKNLFDGPLHRIYID